MKENKISWTNEPKHENKFKTNLKKSEIFKNILNEILDKTIKKCDRSYDICALKFGQKDSNLESTN